VTQTQSPVETANTTRKSLTVDELHHQMGHIAPEAARKLVRDGAITGIELDMNSKPTFCDACAKAKPTQKPILKERSGPLTANIGEKVHSDVWGPANPQIFDGKDYFVSFTNDHSQWTWVEPISHKNEVLMQYKMYEAWLDMQHHAKIKCFQMDHGGEYLSDEFNTHLKSRSTV